MAVEKFWMAGGLTQNVNVAVSVFRFQGATVIWELVLSGVKSAAVLFASEAWETTGRIRAFDTVEPVGHADTINSIKSARIIVGEQITGRGVSALVQPVVGHRTGGQHGGVIEALVTHRQDRQQRERARYRRSPEVQDHVVTPRVASPADC